MMRWRRRTATRMVMSIITATGTTTITMVISITT